MQVHLELPGKLIKFGGDLQPSVLQVARASRVVAWDIETSGLDWRRDQIATCQICIPHSGVYFVHGVADNPPLLKALLGDEQVVKIFHHAMFDLCFMSSHWRVQGSKVCCTKVASKVLSPSRSDHSLKALVRDHLGVTLDKDLAVSDWLSSHLTEEQVRYAVNDVLYLPSLFRCLRAKLKKRGRWQLAQACFDHLPSRVHLELLGAGDVFRH